MINQGYYRPQPGMYRPVFPMHPQPQMMMPHHGHMQGRPGMHQEKPDMAQRRAYQWPNSAGKKYKSINDFEIIKQFGRGGFSEVFKAKSRLDNQIYAIKKIDLLRINLDDYGIIKEEIEIHSTIKGKYIVDFIDWFRDGDLIYIILEFIDGMTLFDYLNRNHPLPEQFIKRVLKQILEGLDVIHKAKIIHKDLKPENVLLDQNLNAKICDFGWSERIKEVNISGTIVYMAPEILKLEAYSEKVDVWTIGVLVYELFHNVEPFRGDQPQVILQSILTQPLRFDKRCPTEAKALVKYILNIDKSYRPKVEQILNHPYLKDFDINQPISMPKQPHGGQQLHLHHHGQQGGQPQQVSNTSSGQQGAPTLHLHHGGQSSNQMYHATNFGNSQQNRNGNQGQVSAGLQSNSGSTPKNNAYPTYDLFENSHRQQNQGRPGGQIIQSGAIGSTGLGGNAQRVPSDQFSPPSLRAENYKQPQNYFPLGSRHPNTTTTPQQGSTQKYGTPTNAYSNPSNAMKPTGVDSTGLQSRPQANFTSAATGGGSTNGYGYTNTASEGTQRTGHQLTLHHTGGQPGSMANNALKNMQGYTNSEQRLPSQTSGTAMRGATSGQTGQISFGLGYQSKPQIGSVVGGALLSAANKNTLNQEGSQVKRDHRA